VIAVQSRPAQELARLAPIVAQAAAAGDGTALALADSAAAHLASAAEEVHRGGPIVLAGSVLRHFTAVHEGVIKRLAATFPSTHLALAEPGEAGAARIAALRITNRP
jgi:N-acetylglucosamine kinase-like BadF-type ATPase